MTIVFSNTTGLTANTPYQTQYFNSDSLISVTVNPLTFGDIAVTLNVLKNIPLFIQLPVLESGKLNFRIPKAYSGSQARLILTPSTNLTRLIIEANIQIDYSFTPQDPVENKLNILEGKINQILVSLGLPLE